MIHFEKHRLANGLTVIAQRDISSPLATVNLLYKVGSKNEQADKTGLAHLLEHLMFEGSKQALHFDAELEQAGGMSNAFTSLDITNYYETLPVENIETALWLESDRMQNLSLDQQKIDTQKKVVTEEFKENYLNQPYGDMWHILSDMCFKKHPYRWPTIGLNIEQIAAFTREDIVGFYENWYTPSNAILSICAPLDTSEIFQLAEKWFACIPDRKQVNLHLAPEPRQTEARLTEVSRNVPVSMLSKVYKMPKRSDRKYYTADMLSDLLGDGKSSRMYKHLVQEQKLFSSISCGCGGFVEEGLMFIQGQLAPQADMATADNAITEVLKTVCTDKVSDEEIQKLQNAYSTSLCYSEIGSFTRAKNLAYYEMLHRADDFNALREIYGSVGKKELQEVAREIFNPANCNTLYYSAN